jgi:hypothetical protein
MIIGQRLELTKQNQNKFTDPHLNGAVLFRKSNTLSDIEYVNEIFQDLKCEPLLLSHPTSRLFFKFPASLICIRWDIIPYTVSETLAQRKEH